MVLFTIQHLRNFEKGNHCPLHFVVGGNLHIIKTRNYPRRSFNSKKKMLMQFADQFEHFYGKNSVTINVHNLRHYADSVLNIGTLLCNSAFPFESNMRGLKKSFNCTTDVVEQIAWNYSIKATTVSKSYSKEPNILRIKHQYLSPRQEIQLQHCGINVAEQKYHIGYEMSFKKKTFSNQTQVHLQNQSTVSYSC